MVLCLNWLLKETRSRLTNKNRNYKIRNVIWTIGNIIVEPTVKNTCFKNYSSQSCDYIPWHWTTYFAWIIFKTRVFCCGLSCLHCKRNNHTLKFSSLNRQFWRALNGHMALVDPSATYVRRYVAISRSKRPYEWSRNSDGSKGGVRLNTSSWEDLKGFFS